jgi:ribonuclease R
MADEGLIDGAPGRAFHKMGGVPKVTVLRVVDVDDGGNAWAVPERWEGEGPEPRLRLQEKGRRSGRLGWEIGCSPAPRPRAAASSPIR